MKLPVGLNVSLPKIRLPKKISNLALKVLMKTKRKSPEICLITGLAFGGAALVIVGVKTWKNKDMLVEDVKDIRKYKDYDSDEIIKESYPELAEMSEEELKSNFRKACFTMGRDIVKTYGLAVILALSSTGFIVGGHHILRKELSAMTSAYALLFDSYKKYREKIIDRYGIEVDQEIMHGVKMIEATDAETGKPIVKAIRDAGANLSMYARWFDEGTFDSTRSKWIWRNPTWKSNKNENIRNLKMIQASANDLFKSKGWFKLNEVYSMLGMPCTEEGEHVGWVLGSGHDDFIDFGVFPIHGLENRQLPINRLFLDLRNPQNSALCDFNVDGCIDYIFKNIFEYDSRSYISGEQRQLD